MSDLKELSVVLIISSAIFRIAKPIALVFSSEESFSRRRNIWIALTVTAFVSPNFWWYTLVAVPLLMWGTKKDSNPIALYLMMMQAIPPILVPIPVVGINELFELDHYKLLSFCVLIPTAWRLTAMLRVAFLFYVDVFILFYVVSRFCTTFAAIEEALATYCLMCGIMSGIAAFEAARHWLLYADIKVRFSGQFTTDAYLLRGDALRAQVSAGHSLTLGVLLALAFGCWLCIRSRIESKRLRVAGGLLLWIGLIAAYSRAPWLGALTIYLIFAALGPRPWSRVLKAVSLVTLVAGAVLTSPLGTRFARVLPFLGGSIDSGGFDYRQRLAERSWELFQAHPLFGDPLVLSNLEDLRQGQGIIDFVNGYAYIGLFYGGIGLALFLTPVIVFAWKAYRVTRTTVRSDANLSLLGAGLTATILGEMLMIATSGFGIGPEKMLYVLVGLAAAYSYISRPASSQSTT
jgi:hypothetical protein